MSRSTEPKGCVERANENLRFRMTRSISITHCGQGYYLFLFCLSLHYSASQLLCGETDRDTDDLFSMGRPPGTVSTAGDNAT